MMITLSGSGFGTDSWWTCRAKDESSFLIGGIESLYNVFCVLPDSVLRLFPSASALLYFTLSTHHFFSNFFNTLSSPLCLISNQH